MALTTSAFAGTSEGPYIGVGIGAYREDLTVSGGGTFGSDKFDVGASIFGGYRWNMGAGSVAAELSHNSNAGELGTSSIATTSGDGVLDGKLENNWAISVLPGYNFTKDTTGFIRIGYTQAKGTVTVNGTTTIAGSESHTFKGPIWGFGVDQAFTPNLAGRIEYQFLDLKSWADDAGISFEPRATGINLSLRFAF